MVKYLAILPLLLLSIYSFSQETINKPDVEMVSYLRNDQNLLPKSLFLVDSSLLFQKYSDKEFHIFFPENCVSKTRKGDPFIFAFLINASEDTIVTSDCDGLMVGGEIQLNNNEEWIAHQKSAKINGWVDCGKQKLPPQKFSILVIFTKEKFDDKTPLRIKLNIGNEEYFSNSIH